MVLNKIKSPKVTLYVGLMVGLISLLTPLCLKADIIYNSNETVLKKKKIQAQDAYNNSKKMSPPVVIKSDKQLLEEKKAREEYVLSASLQTSYGTNLYDYQDGSRSDSFDLLIVPSLKMPFGNLSSKLSYSKNLKDEEDTNDGLQDIPVTFGFPSWNWVWVAPYTMSLKPSITIVIPASEQSLKNTNLQTSVITGLTASIMPDGVMRKDGTWNASFGVTAGRNFHTYEEALDGSVLSQYSSNQTLTLGYTYSDWSFSVDLLHRSRWTYQGNIKTSFVASEEIGYSINDQWSLAVGHSNEASTLKPNGYESNISLIDDNSSTVYMTLGVSI